MLSQILPRLGLVYVHLLFCVFALYYVLSSDLKLLQGDFNKDDIENVAHIVKNLLIGLWITGATMIWMDIKLDIFQLLQKPKLFTKVLCVIVLTINAFVLHYFAFPRLLSDKPLSNTTWRIIAVSGAVSTTSWLCAAFFGLARTLAPVLSLARFLGLYATAIAVAALSGIALSGTLKKILGKGQNQASGNALSNILIQISAMLSVCRRYSTAIWGGVALSTVWGVSLLQSSATSASEQQQHDTPQAVTTTSSLDTKEIHLKLDNQISPIGKRNSL